ncbi:MAG: transposase [Candidatus Omnitrophica bacterium]|nr:transposase [Candidatus Omnitrophota bacterium]
MSKIRRYYEPNAVYNITCNAYARRPIFKGKKAADCLLSTLGYYRYILRFSLYCYCIMPEHLHVIIQPHLKKYNISQIMKHIKGSFARTHNNLTYKSGPIWQNRFYDTILRDEQALMTRINYILQNPIRANIIREAEDYPYSSAKVYLKDEEDHITDKYIAK